MSADEFTSTEKFYDSCMTDSMLSMLSDPETPDGDPYTRIASFRRLRSDSQRKHARQIISYEKKEADESQWPLKINEEDTQLHHLWVPSPVHKRASLSFSTSLDQITSHSFKLEEVDDSSDVDVKFSDSGLPQARRGHSVSAGTKPIVETTSVKKVISLSEKRYINQYLLQERLGRGSYGTVRKCKDITTGITRAMKILNKGNLRSQLTWKYTADNKMERSSALDTAEQEIAIMKKLQHKNIVNLIEVIESDNVLYLILEYIPHGSLAKETAKGKKLGSHIDDVELLRIYMRHMVSGLAYLHSQRICHSDIKPENILIGENNVLKLADFGLSKYLQWGESKEVFKEKEGTLAFQAPECLNETGELKFSMYPTDIWSLGVTLYQLKYGVLPFWSENTEILMNKILDERVRFPTWEKDEDFIDMMKALLHKNPSKRITIKELCGHSWITKRGKYHKIVTSYERASVTIDEQMHAMSPLIKIIPMDCFKENEKTDNESKFPLRSSTDYEEHASHCINSPLWNPVWTVTPCDSASRSLCVSREKSGDDEPVGLGCYFSGISSIMRWPSDKSSLGGNSNSEPSKERNLELLVRNDVDVNARPLVRVRTEGSDTKNLRTNRNPKKSISKSSHAHHEFKKKPFLTIKVRDLERRPLRRLSISRSCAPQCKLSEVCGFEDADIGRLI